MKEFDLRASLNGEPVMLKNGQKAFVKFNLLDDVENLESRDAVYPLFGYRFENNYVYTISWDLSGQSAHWATSEYNIIGMWEEPKISIEDLPKPFKPDIGDEFFYLSVGTVQYCSFYSDINADLMRNGQCFRTREDAQKWINFMKSMME
jgi:hypothetical protein